MYQAFAFKQPGNDTISAVPEKETLLIPIGELAWTEEEAVSNARSHYNFQNQAANFTVLKIFQKY